MIDIPQDVWRRIAWFIDPAVLRDMFSVNRTFFDLAMNERYRTVSFPELRLNELEIGFLNRLKDPAVAKRVRIFHIRPYIKRVPVTKGAHAPWRRIIDKITKRFRHAPAKYSDDIAEFLFDVVSGLTNVTEYTIVWHNLRTIHQSPVHFLAAGLGTSLKRLSLDISVQNMASLVSSDITLDNLEVLELLFRSEYPRTHPRTLAVAVDRIIPFIDNLHHTLQSFAIQSSVPVDFSPIFGAIHYFPKLSNLYIGIPRLSPYLGDPSGLRLFLARQTNTIQSMTLRGTQFWEYEQPADTIYEWINQVLQFDATDADVKNLELGTNLFPIDTSITACIQQFADTLTSLTLTDHYVTHNQIRMAVNGFANNSTDVKLESLRLGAITLSPQLVDLLAEKFPNLRSLDLIVRDVVANEGNRSMSVDISISSISLTTSDHEHMDSYFSEMRSRSYPGWALRDITLTGASTYCLQQMSQHLEVFAECVPTVAARIHSPSQAYW